MALPGGASRYVAGASSVAPAPHGTLPPNPADHSRPGQPQTRPLKIAMVGGGIGGLTAALGLRRNGHEVHVYEQSRLANEVGAAVHLGPNANGVLRRWGIFAEEMGANPMDHLVEYMKDGQLRKYIDLRVPNSRWQHPWHLVSRVDLHAHLKVLATSDDGMGAPVRWYAPSRVVGVDPDQGTLTLQDGSRVTFDLVVGADGIYSTTRKYIKDAKLFASGKAAFRFLIPRRFAAGDPATAPIADRENALFIWYGEDRRIVVYPCHSSQLLNFVCIHPDTESHATRNDAWNKRASVEQLLYVYRDFDVTAQALLNKVDPSALSVFPLLDMEKLPTFVAGKMVLLGDAAHPFTPHQGQGAGQAIEDAAALSVVLPLGTAPADIPVRLKLYEDMRYERAHAIQEYSRLAGQDWENGEPMVDMMAFTNYNFGHDAIDHASIIFQRWQWARDPSLHQRYRGLPTPFGPFFTPRPEPTLPNGTQIPRAPAHHATGITTAAITFKTSRTFLETLFPDSGLRFRDPDTVATASLVARRLSHDGGTADETVKLGLYLHGVQLARPDGGVTEGAYLPVLFDSARALDEVASDVDGAARVRCDVALEHASDGRGRSQCRVVASWRGVSFIEATMSDLQAVAGSSSTGLALEEKVIVYQPAAEGGYACLAMPRSGAGAVTAVTKKVGMKMHVRDWEQLPTLHHVTAVLADIPVYEILGGSVVDAGAVWAGLEVRSRYSDQV